MTVINTSKSIFDTEADIIVNTVNTVGVMGKGIALECKRRYPVMFERYRLLCKNQTLVIGKLWLYQHSKPAVLCFPTKKHWKYKSEYMWIKEGLEKFVRVWPMLRKQGYQSVAFPPLGCGCGGLDFTKVNKMIHDHLDDLEGTFIVCNGKNKKVT